MSNPLTVAVSARSLFNLEDANRIYETKGLSAFVEDQNARQDEPLQPGPAFPLVKALLNLNNMFGKQVVDVLTVSSIHPAAGLRVIRSIAHHSLSIKRTSFTGGGAIFPFLKAYDVDLFLSRSEEDTQKAVNNGIAAALMYDAPDHPALSEGDQIKIAFDGDAVVFSDASEQIYQKDGLEAFVENERKNAAIPMADGPFAKLLRRIQKLQNEAPHGRRPFRLALVTARGGAAQERPIRTLNSMGIFMDEAHFLSGHRKDTILHAIGPHIFFDDQHVHVGPASKLVPSGRVPYIGGTTIAAE